MPAAILATQARLRLRLAAMAAGACLMLVLAFTFARAAYLGAMAASCAVWLACLWRPCARRKRLLMVFAVGAVGAAAMALGSPEVRARVLSSPSQDAASVRCVIWQQAQNIISEHPWGIGLGNYPIVVARYYAVDDPLNPSPRTYPHNMVWMAWAEGGPLGALGFVLFWARLMRCGWRHTIEATCRRRRAAGAALLFVSCALFVVGLTHDVLFHTVVALAFFTALGIASAELAAPAEDNA